MVWFFFPNHRRAINHTLALKNIFHPLRVSLLFSVFSFQPKQKRVIIIICWRSESLDKLEEGLCNCIVHTQCYSCKYKSTNNPLSVDRRGFVEVLLLWNKIVFIMEVWKTPITKPATHHMAPLAKNLFIRSVSRAASPYSSSCVSPRSPRSPMVTFFLFYFNVGRSWHFDARWLKCELEAKFWNSNWFPITLFISIYRNSLFHPFLIEMVHNKIFWVNLSLWEQRAYI